MRKRHAFRPSEMFELEKRVVLSRVVPPVPALVSGLSVRGRGARPARIAPTTESVDKAFASFTEDYSQARGIYFASLAGPAGDADRQAFINFTEQRVNVLAQELVNSLLAASPRRGRQKGDAQPFEGIPRLVGRRINARQANGAFGEGTLAESLIDSIPAANTSPATAALFALSQDNAIEAARVGVLNGITVFKVNNAGRKN